MYSPRVPRRTNLAELEQRLGYEFKDHDLFTMALTHRSYANENPKSGRKENERLEFLGDAVLDLIVGHMLMTRHPALKEGQLSVARSQVVSEAGLSTVARDLCLGEWLLLGKGEDLSGGRFKPSLLADAFEAVVAAVYLDGGFDAAWTLVERTLPAQIEGVSLTGFSDHKTRLQERAQALLKETPVYRVIGESGPDHAKVFEVACMIKNREWARASGRSKKGAEQAAAAAAHFLIEGADLEALDDDDDG